MEQFTDLLASLPPRQGRYLTYLWETMPESDRAGYPVSLFAQFARHADRLPDAVPWCGDPEGQIFLDYVLCHRVNDEDLSFNRSVFFDELMPRVRGLTAEQAVLEVNRWCHERATYELQDDRTASPLTVYRSGSGRCGEESVFAVSALRAIGIPARQVYAPRWSHCADNHAWVEALVEGKWRFFGACEPEPVLDCGWFNAAASRAMLVHSRRFGGAGGAVDTELNGEALDRHGAAVYHNQTARYAKTVRHTFHVTSGGAPVSGARLSLEVINEGQLYPILTLFTDQSGRAGAELGQGDIYLRAAHPLGYAEALCAFRADGPEHHIELAGDYAPRDGWRALDFTAPADAPVNLCVLDRDQKAHRNRQLAEGEPPAGRQGRGLVRRGPGPATGGRGTPVSRPGKGQFRHRRDLSGARRGPSAPGAVAGPRGKGLAGHHGGRAGGPPPGGKALRRCLPGRHFPGSPPQPPDRHGAADRLAWPPLHRLFGGAAGGISPVSPRPVARAL